MKIIRENKVYVQKKDLEFLKYKLHSLPNSISFKIFENDEFDSDAFQANDFIELVEQNDIQYIRSIEWMMDYDLASALSIEELKKIGTE